jgi:hypothetical protein
LISILIFFPIKLVWVIIALFANFNANIKTSNILKKVKSYFLPIAIILRLIPNEIPISIKLKPPTIGQGHPPWMPPPG